MSHKTLIVKEGFSFPINGLELVIDIFIQVDVRYIKLPDTENH